MFLSRLCATAMLMCADVSGASCVDYIFGRLSSMCSVFFRNRNRHSWLCLSQYALFFDRMVVEFRKHLPLDLAFAWKTSRMWGAVNAVRRECQEVCWIVECLELECCCTSVFASVRRTLCVAHFAEDVIYPVAWWIALVAYHSGSKIMYVLLPLRSELSRASGMTFIKSCPCIMLSVTLRCAHVLNSLLRCGGVDVCACLWGFICRLYLWPVLLEV